MKKTDLKKYSLPDTPGCYFFRDTDNNILYIGKATSLKNRVKSYFDLDLINTRGLKIVNMVQSARSITYTETNSVLEALILEARLIKENQPYFNTKEKDDKSFYVVVITKEDFPKVLLVRQRDLEKKIPVEMQKYVYGPFTNGNSIKDALKIVRKIFPFRDKCEVGQGVACFNAQIGLCPGVCFQLVTKKEYERYIKNIKLFFEGKKTELERNLNKEMLTYAKLQNFEKAGEIKKTIFAINHIRDISLIKDEIENEKGLRIESYDAAHISGTSRVGVMVVSQSGIAQKDEYRKFKLKQEINNDVAAYKELFERRFKHKEWIFPDLIVVDGGLPQKNIAEAVLKELKLLHIPVVSVVKDEKHKPKGLLGQKKIIEENKKDILRANSEAHRFAIAYHKLLRGKQVKGK